MFLDANSQNCSSLCTEPMTIPTEPIGSIPRPLKLIDAIGRHGGSDPSLEPFYEEAVRETIELFEATGSPVITEDRKSVV